MASSKKSNKVEQRRLRTQQIIMGIIGILVILSMVLAAVMTY